MATSGGRKGARKTTERKQGTAVEKSAGAVVFHRGSPVEYLLIFSTYWEFPKGMIDPAESEEDAARREVSEETGLDVDLVPGFREGISYFYRRRESGLLVKKQVVYFLGAAHTKQVRISWEHREARWVSYEAALDLVKYENARSILAKANDKINENIGD